MLKTQIFEKEGKLSTEEKFLDYFFSYYRVLQNSKDIFQGSRRQSGKYCGRNKIKSLGHKKSIETIISKNRCFHDDKSLWPNFRRIIECEKPQEANYGGSQALVTIAVEAVRAFFKEH